MQNQGRAGTGLTKNPPYSFEAEQAVLGGLMLDNLAWDDVSLFLTSHDFYRKEHQVIYQVLESLAQNASPFDAVTILEALKTKGLLEAAGGEIYLYELVNNTPSAANIRSYANIVRDRSTLRQLITAATDITETAYQPEGRTTAELLDEAEQKVFSIAEQNFQTEGPKDLKSLLQKTVERIDQLYQSDSTITGVETGFSQFDEMTSGLQPSDLVILAGRPSMGKTALGMNMVEHAAIKTGKPVLIFSMEMPGDALAMRMMSSLGRIDQHKLRTGKIDDDDWPRITSAVSMLSEAPIFIDDTPSLSPGDMRARARRLVREHGEVAMVLVDYLQLMRIPGYRADTRTAEISEISRSLKALAKEINAPVIALSQLNRSLEQRHDKRPVMSDLRESGAIEQDADLIAFIYRDEVYHEDSQDKGTAEIIVAKQRNGPIGKVRLTFLGQYTRFENYATQNYAVPA